MLKEFIDKEKNIGLSREIELEKKIQSNAIRIKELDSLIEAFDKEESSRSDDLFFTSKKASSPVDKADYYKLERKYLLQENKQIQEEIDFYNSQAERLRILLDNIFEKRSKVDKDVFRYKLLETQELERQRIARDLHDSSVQTLTNLVHKIEYVYKIYDNDSVLAKLELKNAQEQVRQVIDEMRDVIYCLRPMSFEDIGFEETLDRELVRLENIGNCRIDYSSNGDLKELSPVVCLTLFRIVQEACTNSIKHSNAKVINVSFEVSEETVKLIISDDGEGFDYSDYEKNQSSITSSNFGISMMKERVYLLSGDISFESKIGEGTKITVKVPKYVNKGE